MPSPFDDMASRYIPDTQRSALSMCEYIWNQQETYRMACERMIAYFLTDLQIGHPLGEDEKERWYEYLTDHVNLLLWAQRLLQDRRCYGNAFFSWMVPFRRFIDCPTKGCGTRLALQEMRNPEYNFKLGRDLHFEATCPKCKKRGQWAIHDEKDTSATRLHPKLWSVHEMEIAHDPLTDEKRYAWRIPEFYKTQIREGNLFLLEQVDKDVLEAIRKNYLFVFEPDQIYHAYEPIVSGVRTRGWGISQTLVMFRQIWYVQVLRRYSEAVAMDFVIPWRVITPAPAPGSGGLSHQDPALGYDMGGGFMAPVRRMLSRRMRDPLNVSVLPFPIQYQSLGAEARQLAPADLMNQGLEQLLNGAGVPAEMYRGTMQVQTIPAAIRMFESLHRPLVWELNRFVRWSMQRLGEMLGWQTGSITVTSPTYLDDINKQMAMLQLMAGQTISKTTALKGFGIKNRDEMQLKQEEARQEQEMQARMQEEMSQDAFTQQIAKGQDPNAPPPGATAPGAGGVPGAPPAGGAPAGGPAAGMAGPESIMALLPPKNQPITMQDITAIGSQIASMLLSGQFPEPVKDSILRQLKQENEAIHASVRQQMDVQRNQARLQGGAMLLNGGMM